MREEKGTMENNCSRAPFGDKTNTANAAADAKERKRERDRARWHAMSQEKKDAINKKRRDALSQEQKDAINKRRCDSYRQRKNQHVSESIDYDDAASNKENVIPETSDWLHRNNSCQTNQSVDENMSSQLSYEPEMESTMNESTMKSKSRRTYFSERYKNMTPEQKEARREHQRLYNSEPTRKRALKISDKSHGQRSLMSKN